MVVPKAAVYEDDGMIFGKDDVWLAGKVLFMDTEPVSQFM